VSEFGLKDRRGAVVAAIQSGGPADKAGVEPGDVILDVNGKRIADRDQLVQEIVGLKPGTTVPIRVLRNRQERTLNVTIGELNLDAEADREARTEGEDAEGTGFGITLGNLTADRARRSGVPAETAGAFVIDVDPNGPAARSGLQPGDVILQVNRQEVSSAADARRLLQQVQEGGTAFVLVLRRGSERFLTIEKD
jgi:serine protease Do